MKNPNKIFLLASLLSIAAAAFAPVSPDALRYTMLAIAEGTPPFVLSADLAQAITDEGGSTEGLNVCEGAIDYACLDEFDSCMPWQAVTMGGVCEDPVYVSGGACWYYPSYGEESMKCSEGSDPVAGGGGGSPGNPPPGGQKVCSYGGYSNQYDPPPDYLVGPDEWVEGFPYNWMICHYE